MFAKRFFFFFTLPLREQFLICIFLYVIKFETYANKIQYDWRLYYVYL